MATLNRIMNKPLVSGFSALRRLSTTAASLLLLALTLLFSLSAQAVATTTTLTTSVTTAVVGVNVTLTASVKGLTPTGLVTFKDGTTTIGTASTTGTTATRTAVLTTNFTVVGSHSITAVYAGDVDDATSTSTAKVVTATIKATTTTLTTSVTSAAVGANVTLTASVAGYTPTGTVTFKDGTATLGTGTLTGTGTTGTATLTTTFSTVASHSITVVYVGDPNDATSTSTAKAISVTKAATTTTLTTSVTSAVIGQSVTLTATVAGFSPSGNVAFKDGTTTIATVATTGTGTSRTATFSATFSTAGSHSITAVYATNTTDNTSTSTAKVVTVTTIATTTTTLTSSLTTATVGQSVTLTASTMGFTPTGSVTYKDGATTIGTGTLTGSGSTATATLTTTFSSTGAHSITAVYAGDVNDATSTSAAPNITVNAVATNTTLSASPTTATVGQSVTLTATTTGLTPTGNVVFKDGTTTIGTVATTGTGTSRTATLSTTFATTGAHSITGAYAGDADDASSTSAASNVTVNAPNVAPTVSITAPANNASFTAPASITLTANATDSDGTITKVDFYNGATLLNTDTTAPYSYNLTGLAVGSYSLTAVATDNSNATTTSAVVTITVVANIPPSISIITPSDNSSVTLPATVTIAANATDSDGSITKVDFYSNAILMSTASTAPYSVTLAGFTLGSYTFSAMATDNSGASTTSAPVHISVISGVPQVYYIHTDQLNTPRLITDSTNTPVWRWDDADPFANNVPNDDPNATGNHFSFNQRFAGQYFDKETNTNYNYFRDYDAENGTYRQSDPIGLYGEQASTYAYVGGKPLSYVDPRGKNAKLVVGLAIYCAENPRVCAVLGSAVAIEICRSMGGCKIPDSAHANKEEGKSCPVDLPDKIPDFDFDDPTKTPVGPDGAEWPWVEGKKPGTGGFKNPNGPESISPDLEHGEGVPPHWDFNDRKSNGYRIFPDGTISPK